MKFFDPAENRIGRWFHSPAGLWNLDAELYLNKFCNQVPQSYRYYGTNYNEH
jgi:hypothetical protein